MCYKDWILIIEIWSSENVYPCEEKEFITRFSTGKYENSYSYTVISLSILAQLQVIPVMRYNGKFKKTGTSIV